MAGAAVRGPLSATGRLTSLLSVLDTLASAEPFCLAMLPEFKNCEIKLSFFLTCYFSLLGFYVRKVEARVNMTHLGIQNSIHNRSKLFLQLNGKVIKARTGKNFSPKETKCSENRLSFSGAECICLGSERCACENRAQTGYLAVQSLVKIQ